MKPNAHELAECVGKDLNTIGDVIDAARELNDWGVNCVMASLGIDGIVAITKTHAIHAFTAPVKVINTVGAGDALFSAFIHGINQHQDPYRALRQACLFAGWKIGTPRAAEGFLHANELAQLAQQHGLN